MKRFLFPAFIVLFFISFLFPPSDAFAQQKEGSIKVEAIFKSSTRIDGLSIKWAYPGRSGKYEYTYGLEEAIVILKQGQDTVKYLSTDMLGLCVFKHVPYGKYSVTIQYTGYDEFFVEFDHDRKMTEIKASMTESTFLLDEVKVKGNIPLVISDADTLIVNPKAVQTKEGAAALEIIKQVPGIEVDESGSIKAFGEPLSRTYVGGSAMFGKDLMGALKNIDAEMVKNIKFYDEVEEVSNVNGKRITRKVRSMNIETTKKFLASFAGHVLAGVGKDVGNGKQDDGKVRYKGGVSFDMNSEKFTVKGEAYYNNVGLRGSSAHFMERLLSNRFSGELNLGGASIELEKRKGEVYKDGSSLAFKYRYGNTKSSGSSTEEREYDPTAEYLERVYSSGSENSSKENNHRFSLDYYRNTYDKDKVLKNISFNHSTVFGNKYQENLSFYNNRTDGRVDAMRDSVINDKRSWNTQEQLNLFLGKKTGAFLSASFEMGEDKGDSFRKLEENGALSDYESSPVGKYLEANLNLNWYLYHTNTDSYTKVIKGDTLKYHPRFGVDLKLDSRYKKEKNRHIRYDVTRPQFPIMDSLNSSNYTYDYWQNTLGLSLQRYVTRGTDDYGDPYLNYGLSADVQCVTMNDSENLMDDVYKKTYWSPEINAQFGYKKIYVSYSLRNNIPAKEMIRRRVNDGNPMYLQAGNPNLKLPMEHGVNLSCYFGDRYSGMNAFNVSGNIHLVKNAIIPYTMFYKDGAVLEDHDNYQVAPGATFSSYRNARKSMNARLYADYSGRISALRTRYTLGLSGSYRQSPSYDQAVLNTTNSWDGAFSLNLNTTVKWLSLDLNSHTSYTTSKNTRQNDYKYFNQQVRAYLNLDPFKVWFINASYDFIFNQPVGGTQGFLNRNNILSASTGVKLFKSRLKASISVFDIFNSSTDFQTMRYGEYVQNTWSPTFGRYVSFDVLFNLRSYKYKG